MPFYNVEKWIKFCILSAKKQKYKNFNCVLVNDHSTDNTVSVIENLIKKDDRFELVLNPEKTGALGSIYHGTEHSKPSGEDVI